MGKFDTQLVFYQNLGLDEKTIVSQNGNYLDPNLHLEEEVLAYEYKDKAYQTSKSGSQDFIFKLGFASRRVMTVASQHVPVSVVSVDGINPMTNTAAVYNGTYKFSRKIHLLVRENGPVSALKLVDFLRSASGQTLITNSGYLPLMNSQ